MLVRVLKKRVPRVGKKGDTAEVPDRLAKTLILIGSVEPVAATSKPTLPTPPSEPSQPVVVDGSPSRYERRDMQAEDLQRPPAARKRRST